MKLLNAAVGRIAKLIKKNSSDDKDMASLTEGYLRVTKGVISKIGQIGFEIEPDKSPNCPMSFTWESMKVFKFVVLPKTQE